MKSSPKKTTSLLAAAMLAACMATPAASQESVGSYPSKPITLIFNSSGTTTSDTEMRLYQNLLKTITSTTMVFDYKGGAGGAIGAVYVSRQKPDGYSYLATPSTILTVPMLNKDAGYDMLRDLEPLTLMSKRNILLVVRNDAPFRTVKEYIDYARANPGKVNFGTSGEGSSPHLAGLLLHSMSRTEVTFVHYKQANDRMIDLIAGRTDAGAGTVLATLGFIKAGKMRAIGVTDNERSPLLPDLPTVAESGAPGLSDYESTTWLGLFAPAKTPAPLIGKFNDLLKQAARDPALKKALAEADTTQVVNTPAQFRQFLVKEHDNVEKALKAAGIKPQ